MQLVLSGDGRTGSVRSAVMRMRMIRVEKGRGRLLGGVQAPRTGRRTACEGGEGEEVKEEEKGGGEDGWWGEGWERMVGGGEGGRGRRKKEGDREESGEERGRRR